MSHHKPSGQQSFTALLETLAGGYKGDNPEATTQILNVMDVWKKQDPSSYSSASVQQLLGYLSGFPAFPIRKEQIEMALGYPDSLSEFVHQLQIAPLNTMRSWAKSLFTSARDEESFVQYRVIVEGMENYLRTDDDYELYRKCIESMTGMLGAEGELKNKQDYPLYRLIPYLQVIIDHGVRDEMLTHFLKEMQDRLATLRNPAIGERSPEISSVNQHPYTMSPVEIRPLQIAEGSTVDNPELPGRDSWIKPTNLYLIKAERPLNVGILVQLLKSWKHWNFRLSPTIKK